MSKIRMCYTQGDGVRFISHLDFMRTIARTFRRAELPVKYSSGFNPHMVMTIGLPLSVGTTSVCDCLDVELTEDMPYDEIMRRVNECAPRAIEITHVKSAEGEKPLYQIDSAEYNAKFVTSRTVDLGEYIAAPRVMIEKKSKRKVNEVNIKDFIRKIEVEKSDGINHEILMHINAGNFSNLKPELVLKSMSAFYDCEISGIDIERRVIYFDDMTRVF